ncbi:MAG: hypothetical protein ACXQTW_06240 [Candidatus Methanospirareceae archaeon]
MQKHKDNDRAIEILFLSKQKAVVRVIPDEIRAEFERLKLSLKAAERGEFPLDEWIFPGTCNALIRVTLIQREQ